MDKFVEKKKNQLTLKKPIKLKLSYRITLPEGDSWMDIFPIIPSEIQMDQNIFQNIWDMHPKELANGFLYGQKYQFKRYEQLYGHNYRYAGIDHVGLPLDHTYMIKLSKWVADHAGHYYHGPLIVWYENGQHKLGAHSDDEKDLVKGSSIYSFSFGQSRDFVVKSKKDPNFRKVIPTKHNSLIIMGGQMQTYYKHEIPPRALSKCPGPRMCFTFRNGLRELI